MSGSGEPEERLSTRPAVESTPPDKTAMAASEKTPRAGFATRFFKPNKMKTAPNDRIR